MCRAITVFENEDKEYVRRICPNDYAPGLCSYHQRMKQGATQPYQSQFPTALKVVRVENEGVPIWTRC